MGIILGVYLATIIVSYAIGRAIGASKPLEKDNPSCCVCKGKHSLRKYIFCANCINKLGKFVKENDGVLF